MDGHWKTKMCNKCYRVFPVAEFPQRKSGLSDTCQLCCYKLELQKHKRKCILLRRRIRNRKAAIEQRDARIRASRDYVG